ncbi:alpha-N-acetylneuraminide alpha-2,8-sialyltransferase-like isoform X2 [Scleropages formosus]|uniref:Alpha-N-acetylneuraminide alpha-2,8-sialyltransferase n=1 Tax=Scleropages formosus TaxID=113540 RepID=A0A8C9TBZ3_SCLFO|nr:alpha-N-acetylneuraminide alpha-2,8-sialyltransferase-like isoform X2 [Scleropages formosus]
MMMMMSRYPRSRWLGWAALCVVVLYWVYNYPVCRLPTDTEIVQEVLRHAQAWKQNKTAIRMLRKLLEDCCEPRKMFALTKENSPMGKVLWYDGEFYYSHTVNKDTYQLFVKEPPLRLPLKKCSVVGNGGILKQSGCGREIDLSDFIMRCNLPPLSKEYTNDIGTRTHLVTANPSIIEKRFNNLQWSRKPFVESMKVYGKSYIYMPAFSMKPGTEPSLRAYYALNDVDSDQMVLFANPDFLKNVDKFWKRRGIRAKRLSTGLFMVSLALGLCEEVTIYGFWPFNSSLGESTVKHHYYDNVLPFSGFHTMSEEFRRLWQLHKEGVLHMRIGSCPAQVG